MKNKMKNIFFSVIMILVAVIFFSCDKSSSTSPEPVIPPVEVPDPPEFLLQNIEVKGTTITVNGYVTTEVPIEIAITYKKKTLDYFTSLSTTVNPGKINVSSPVSATITGLELGTEYQFKMVFTETISKKVTYSKDSTFATSAELKIGDVYKKGVVIKIWDENSKKNILLASERDLTGDFDPSSPPGYGYVRYSEAIALCNNYGPGWVLPDSNQAKQIREAYKVGLLSGFINPIYDSYGRYMTIHIRGNLVFGFTVFSHIYGDRWYPIDTHMGVRAVTVLVV